MTLMSSQSVKQALLRILHLFSGPHITTDRCVCALDWAGEALTVNL